LSFADIAQPGANQWLVAGFRAAITVLGGAVALAGFRLWPNFEPQRLLQRRNAIAALGCYAASLMSHLSGEDSVAVVERARRAAGIASNSLEASASRVLVERAKGLGSSITGRHGDRCGTPTLRRPRDGDHV